MIRRFATLGLVVAIAFMMTPAAAATQQYVAGSAGDVTVYCRNTPAGQVNVGGACFTRGAGPVTVKIADAHGEPVGFWWVARDIGGARIGELVKGGCASATSGKLITLPSGTVSFEIWLDGPAFTALQPQCGAAAPATVGTITI